MAECFGADLAPRPLMARAVVAAAFAVECDGRGESIARRVPPAMADQVKVDISPLGEDGIAIGAARLAMLARS